ncbi:methyl-cpg-binding domain-containing protein 2 [Phtheirospermum japonicum]|uniref:Methyl-cpg-binding domain-containing protein 2 n=1 Tax=Phtheirospermum japonicum TaxID=374723 RepID=A0A830B236_9LAMI|nr:methyl-cpg-binding domain-containing protein 2 [Phtheirospermum japonicum]
MMETATAPRSLKVTIKLKRHKDTTNPSTTADHPKNVENKPNTLYSSNLPHSLPTPSHDRTNISPTEVVENHTPEDKENPRTDENSQYQLVLYDPSIVNGNTENRSEPINHQPPFRRPHPFSDQAQRVLPSIGAFTVQCANCFKWRLIPTKEKYEEIREHIMEQPFLCETAREWRSDISCDDAPDITQDGSRLWAIDKPSIAQPPPGWQRLLRIRGEGSTKFADVYYAAPTGKRLRSMVEVQKPLQENYVRKRPLRPASLDDAGDPVMPGYLPPSEVRPITWINPDVDTDLQLSGPMLSNHYFESSGSNPKSQSQPAKKKGKKRRFDDILVYDLDEPINAELLCFGLLLLQQKLV